MLEHFMHIDTRPKSSNTFAKKNERVLESGKAFDLWDLCVSANLQETFPFICHWNSLFLLQKLPYSISIDWSVLQVIIAQKEQEPSSSDHVMLALLTRRLAWRDKINVLTVCLVFTVHLVTSMVTDCVQLDISVRTRLVALMNAHVLLAHTQKSKEHRVRI